VKLLALSGGAPKIDEKQKPGTRNQKRGIKVKKRNYLICFSGIMALLLVLSNAHAHNLWLNPGNHYPEVGETVDVGIGWGHEYPESRTDQEVKEDTVKQIKEGH
jgi:uncharacterized GH25 family protein